MTLAVHYFPTADSALAPIVLLHGFASSARADYLDTGWPAALNAAGRTVIAVDLPGHGDSPAVADAADATTSAVVAQILEAVAAVAPEGPLDVIGYSLGGRIGWELPTASPRVRRVVLGGVSPFDPFSAIEPGSLEAVIGGADPAHPLVGALAALITAAGQDTDSLVRLVAGLGSEPFAPQRGGPAVPTLLVAGTDDQMTQGVDGIAEALPDSAVIRVPGDHREALDSPEFRAAALEFLAQQPTG